jgi:hypothetical protein
MMAIENDGAYRTDMPLAFPERIDVPVTESEFRILSEAFNAFHGALSKQYAEVHQWEGPEVIRLSAEQKCVERIDAFLTVSARLNIHIQEPSAITESQAGENTK